MRGHVIDHANIVRRVLQAWHWVKGVTGLALGGGVTGQTLTGVTGLALGVAVTGLALGGN